MGNLLVSLRNAAGAMNVFERGTALVQANVTNASTPGYAKQRQLLVAMASDLDRGLVGGVESGGTLDSRSSYAEMQVRRQTVSFGFAEERAQQLSRLEAALGIQANSGIASSMDRFFQSVSALEVAPNDTAARQLALERAADTALAFRQTASNLDNSLAAASQAIVSQTAQLNEIGERLLNLNEQFRNDFRAQNDAGLAAQAETLMEELAAISDSTVLRSENGCINVYLGGQTPFLMGGHLFPVTADVAGSSVRLLDSQGKDFSSTIQGGRLGALLETRNSTIPSYLAELDALAGSLADSVNAVLAAGVDLAGNSPAAGLFAYDATAGAARTLGVNGISAAQLALASPGSPGGNDNARVLAALARQKTTGGFTFTEAYGNLSARAGRDLTSAEQSTRIQRQLHTQARELRDEISRVNLDEEAALLLEYQRSYQAAAKLFQTIDEMTQTVIGLIR